MTMTAKRIRAVDGKPVAWMRAWTDWRGDTTRFSNPYSFEHGGREYLIATDGAIIVAVEGTGAAEPYRQAERVTPTLFPPDAKPVVVEGFESWLRSVPLVGDHGYCRIGGPRFDAVRARRLLSDCGRPLTGLAVAPLESREGEPGSILIMEGPHWRGGLMSMRAGPPGPRWPQ